MSVAPFEVAVINLKSGDAATDKVCAGLVAQLEQAGVDVLYDDRDERAGAKFATMDLIGIPYQLIVGPKGVKAGEVEIKVRKGGDRRTRPLDQAGSEVIALVNQARSSA